MYTDLLKYKVRSGFGSFDFRGMCVLGILVVLSLFPSPSFAGCEGSVDGNVCRGNAIYEVLLSYYFYCYGVCMRLLFVGYCNTNSFYPFH